MSTTDTCLPESRASAPEAAAARPVYDAREQDGEVVLQVALPGVRKEDLTITAEGQTLVVRATRSDESPETWKTHRPAARPKHYELKVQLGRDYDPQRAAATLQHGVLTLRIEAREETRPREIEVR